MFTDKQLEQLANLLKPIKEQLTTIELNVEILRSENKKAHTGSTALTGEKVRQA
jgi:hypothetical protein